MADADASSSWGELTAEAAVVACAPGACWGVDGDTAYTRWRMEASALICWAVLVVQAAVIIYHQRVSPMELYHAMKLSPILTLALLLAATMVRAVWLTLKALGYDTLGYKPGARLVNRIASLLLVSGFTVYLQMWALFLNENRGLGSSSAWQVKSVQEVYTRGKWIRKNTLHLNLLLWVLVLGVMLAAFIFDDIFYQIDNLLIGALGLLIATAFSVYGGRMYCTMAASSAVQNLATSISQSEDTSCHDTSLIEADKTQLAKIKAAMKSIMLMSSVCTGCFLLRFVCWTWEPIIGTRAPAFMYPWGFYTVVELLPSTMLVVMLARTMPRRGESDESNKLRASWSSPTELPMGPAFRKSVMTD